MRYEDNLIYYTQEVCLNGHQLWTDSDQNKDPNPVQYCEDCGKKIICTCQECNSPIDGQILYRENMYPIEDDPSVPNFCRHCGMPYPWTVSIMKNTIELLNLDNSLSNIQIESVEKSIPDLLVDTPRTKVAAVKFKQILSGTGSIVKEGLRELLVDVVSETAKKILFP
ncbi:MAG TPA: DUF2321 domain-containing protein [Enterococcus sp.]|nr:DUF2321 domain-containing protein [Enterococcus sp.]